MRLMGPIFSLFHYFVLCFSFLKFGFWFDLALEYVCNFSKMVQTGRLVIYFQCNDQVCCHMGG